MKGRYLSNWLAFMTCAQLTAGAVTNAHAGATETIAFGGTVNQLLGTGNGVANGSTVSGTITVDLASLILVAGNGSSSGASVYNSPSSVVDESINGNTTITDGARFFVTVNGLDGNNNNVDIIAIGWGADALGICYPTSVFSNSSPSSILAAVNAGLSGALPYNGDATFNVGMDPTGFNGAQGNLSTFYLVRGPVLTLSLLTNNQVRVSWPTNNATGFQLYSSPTLGTNATWTSITNIPILRDGCNQIEFPISRISSKASWFFRLGPTN